MKEDLLQYVWKFQLLEGKGLTTIQGESIQVVFPGIHNRDSGPDFLNSKIRIADQLWVGTVEIHINSSHWYWHQHEIDENYDAVILHVVWDHDVDVYMKNNKVLPTLELKNVVFPEVIQNYSQLSKSMTWIPCEEHLNTVDAFIVSNWMERLYVERLENKSVLINDLLKRNKNDWDAVFFILMAKSFGLNKNGDAFFQLANSFPLSLLRKYSNDRLRLESLLFGQAGFLMEKGNGSYYQNLHEEYEFLRAKHQLNPISRNTFQFFRMRPSNFPTIRLAQLASLFYKRQNLFSVLMELNSIDDFYEQLSIEVSEFWRQHFTFEKRSKKSSKKLSRPFIDLLIINTVIPLKFAYLKAMNKEGDYDSIKLISQIQPEKNTTIKKFQELSISVNNALDSQSLIQLKNNYCAPKRCLECAIGNTLVRS